MRKRKVYLVSQLLLVVVFAKLKVNSFTNSALFKKAEMRGMRQRCIINVLQPLSSGGYLRRETAKLLSCRCFQNIKLCNTVNNTYASEIWQGFTAVSTV